jgi:hypothetical protein
VSKTGEKLLEDALKLALSERAELAAELLASLDGAPDADAEAAWAAEIERRAARAVNDRLKLKESGHLAGGSPVRGGSVLNRSPVFQEI